MMVNNGLYKSLMGYINNKVTHHIGHEKTKPMVNNVLEYINSDNRGLEKG